METFVQFGAGAIGRSFMGQLFSGGGYEVVFIEASRRLVAALNELGQYTVVIKRGDGSTESMIVKNVAGIDAENVGAAAMAVAKASFVATSVGKSALPLVFPTLAEGILLRKKLFPGRPLDIIIAENMSDGARFMRDGLGPLLPENFPFDSMLGLVETSIGKMVPIMRAEDVAKDPLRIFAEAYNELIVDGRGFKGEPPRIETLKPVPNIRAYVDRKLFVHNLGHAAVAYLGRSRYRELVYVWEALEKSDVRAGVEAAMGESARALAAEYPEDLPIEALEAHCADLLDRFGNRYLDDTLHRVGRDLYRKLGKRDRLVGALLLAARHGLPCDAIARVVAAAASFAAPDERGRLFPPDAEFLSRETSRGLRHVLTDVVGLSPDDPLEKSAIERVLGAASDER